MGMTFIWILIQRNTYVCVRYCYLLCVHVFTYVWVHVCRDMCMCVQGAWEKGGEPQVSFPTSPPLWGRILTSLNRLDRLVGEHQGLADLHLPKLGLQMMHPTMPSYLFFQCGFCRLNSGPCDLSALGKQSHLLPSPILIFIIIFLTWKKIL